MSQYTIKLISNYRDTVVATLSKRGKNSPTYTVKLIEARGDTTKGKLYLVDFTDNTGYSKRCIMCGYVETKNHGLTQYGEQALVQSVLTCADIPCNEVGKLVHHPTNCGELMLNKTSVGFYEFDGLERIVVKLSTEKLGLSLSRQDTELWIMQSFKPLHLLPPLVFKHITNNVLTNFTIKPVPLTGE